METAVTAFVKWKRMLIAGKYPDRRLSAVR
jgi:hypothetical protein